MRIGTDIISIDRIRQAVVNNPRFFEKILTKSEQMYYDNYTENRKIEFLAGRFCAKEAYVKALQTGIGIIKFTDISIVPNEKGVPVLAKAPLIDGVQLSISHCKEYATATVLIELSDDAINSRLKGVFPNDTNE